MAKQNMLRDPFTAEEAANIVRPAASTDTTRPHLCAPYAADITGKPSVVATDGHRLHIVRFADARKLPQNPDVTPPPADHVVPRILEHLGELVAESWKPARAIPRSWSATIEVGGLTSPVYLTAGKSSTATPKKSAQAPRNELFNRTPVPWGGGVEVGSLAVNLHYLLDAIELIGTSRVQVWREPPAPKEKLAWLNTGPFVFTAAKGPLENAGRIAVVMGIRL